jgi:CRISPR-associated protein Cas2
MRSRYIVTYDICDPVRLRQVYKTMRGFGDHLQYSVFRCDLSDMEKVRMIGVLGEIINHVEDQVLIIHIGPAEGRGGRCIEAVGRPYTERERHAIVV